MDYDAMLKQALFNIENDMYNNMMRNAFDIDSEEAKAAFEVIYALNRRGVSSKVVFEAINEVSKELNKPDE